MAGAGTRVILAYFDPMMLGAGARALYDAGYEVVGLCDNGPDTIRMIEALEPDVVMMSLYLRERNAIEVMKWLSSALLTSMPAVALAIPERIGEYAGRAEQMGAYAVLPLPVLPADMVAAVRTAGPMDRMIPCFAREMIIRDILDRMSLNRKLKGYDYLVTAIGITCRSRLFFRAMTTVVYPETAKVHETSEKNVERCIRHAIDAAWMKGDMERQYTYFGNTIDGSRGKPTNSEFIARVTEALRLEAM